MTNPQLTEHLLAVIRSLPAADRAWLLQQLERDEQALGDPGMAGWAMAGGAFDDLPLEPDVYSFSDGQPVNPG
jgi:hypothetical protein